MSFLLCCISNEYFHLMLSFSSLSNFPFVLVKLLFHFRVFFLSSHLDGPYDFLLFVMETICSSYCESKTSVQNSFLVTIINLFQKTGSFLLRSQDKIPLPCTDASFPRLMFVQFLLFTVLKFLQTYPDTVLVNRFSGKLYPCSFSALPMRKLP